MKILKSKSQRLFFIIAVIGTAIFIFRAFIWLNMPGHNIYAVTNGIPNAWESRSSGSRAFLIQNHITCKWTSKNPNSIKGKPTNILAEDTFYALSGSCLKGLSPTSDANDLIFKISGYELALSAEPYVEFVNYSDDEITTTGKPIKEQYFDYVDLSSFSSITKNKAAECLITSPLWCVENSRSTRINAKDIFLKDFYFKLGIFLIILGISGSFFAFLFTAIWNQTIGRILSWIKSGN